MNSIKRFLSYFYPITIEKRIGNYLPTLEVDLRNGEYLLNGKNVNYSFGSLHHLFYQAFKQFRIEEEGIKNVLILGFGAGSVAHILQKEFKMTCAITGVEIDSVMLELASEYFDLASYQNTRIVCEDANIFIRQDKNMYDLIIVDLFVERRVPKPFIKPSFIQELKQHLSPNGFLFFNRINENPRQQEETRELISTMNFVFEGETKIVNIHKQGTDNTFLVYHGILPKEEMDVQLIEEMEVSML